MSEKARKLLPEEKLRTAKEYPSGKGSTYSIANKYGVTDTSIRRQVDRYKIDEEQAFRKKPLASLLSHKENLRVVYEYLQEVLSLRDIALKYGLEISAFASGLQNMVPEEKLLFFQIVPKSITVSPLNRKSSELIWLGKAAIRSFMFAITFLLVILLESGF